MILLRKLNSAAWWLMGSCGEVSAASADAYKNVPTTASKLSWYEVGEGDKDELLEVLVALTAGSSNLKPAPYCLLDRAEIEEAGFSVKSTEGQTRLQQVNKKHVDIVGLTVASLSDLVRLCMTRGRMGKVSKQDLSERLKVLVDDGVLHVDDLKPDVAKHLNSDR